MHTFTQACTFIIHIESSTKIFKLFAFSTIRREKYKRKMKKIRQKFRDNFLFIL